MNITDEKKEEFAKNNFGLVHSCANRFRGKGIEYDDLFSTGCVGLIKAIDAFDEDRGVKFSTYAVPVILGEIKRLFRDGGAIKVSRGLKELSLKLNKIRERFINDNAREPTVNELAQKMSITVEEVSEAISAGLPPVSLTPVDDEGETVEINIGVDAIDEQLTDAISLRDAIKRLEEKDKQLILLRYYRYKTQSETAKILSMTQVQVSRREKKILKELRCMLN